MNASEVRASLSHPVIDSDAHWLEFGPMVIERLRAIGGEKAASAFTGLEEEVGVVQAMGPDERRQKRLGHPGFWMLPMANTRDRATAMMPSLLYERLDELGFDFCVMYPTGGTQTTSCADDEVRRAGSRAFNIFSAEHFADHADRLTPVALIPMNTPDEAIAELEFVRRELGLKAALLRGMVPRRVPAIVDGDAEASELGVWYDVFGLDSEYDYDPVWECCVELGISPTFHAGGRGYALRRSPSNFTYNHIGHFGSTGEAMCKALFLGGVTRRFPTLRFAFLEGGSSWACQLLADLVEHWEKRNAEALEQVNPENLDHEYAVELARRYGPPGMAELMADRGNALFAALSTAVSTNTGGEPDLDDYAACEISHESDLRDLFVDSFYFGCEADDRMNAWAFDERTNHFGAKINALFSSDIGHFDVPDMERVLPEAFELVEEGVMSKEDFRAFTFVNPAKFWASSNPEFFDGTVVEREVAAVLDR